MMDQRKTGYLDYLRQRPNAWANIYGSKRFPNIGGMVRFYQTRNGVLVVASVKGLPMASGKCDSPIFGFHIHEGGTCQMTQSDSFADVGNHYNPYNCKHPYHAGDMPPLFGANGEAFSVFLSNRFTVQEIIGRTVIIHASPDDFFTQPSGNSGEKIACGLIRN